MKLLAFILLLGLTVGCTKTVVHNFYTPVHDTLYRAEPFVIAHTDTVFKKDLHTDTTIEKIHDTLFITKTSIDSIKITDTVYLTSLNLPPYQGDSVLIFVIVSYGKPDPLVLKHLRIDDMTMPGRYFEGMPDSVGRLWIPNYPLSSITAQVTNMTDAFVLRLESFEFDHAVESRVRFEGQSPSETETAIINYVAVETASNLYIR